MATYCTQYGLSTEPYELRELNPLSFPEDAQLVQEVYKKVGAYSELGTIEACLEKNAQDDQPMFFLVKGPDGCGRSSIANFIMSRYCHHRGIARQNFFIPKKNTDHSDAFLIMNEWMGLLINQIERSKKLPSSNLTSFRDKRKDASIQDYKTPLQSLAWNISSQLHDVPSGRCGFGVCLEDVRAPALIDAAFTIFETARTICVFTVGDYQGEKRKVIAKFEEDKEQRQKQSLPLRPLGGTDIQELVNERWDRASNKAVPTPFPKDLSQAFAGRERPVKRVMVLMNKLLELKSADHGQAKTWPTSPELGFQLQELIRKIAILDEPLSQLDELKTKLKILDEPLS